MMIKGLTKYSLEKNSPQVAVIGRDLAQDTVVPGLLCYGCAKQLGCPRLTNVPQDGGSFRDLYLSVEEVWQIGACYP